MYNFVDINRRATQKEGLTFTFNGKTIPALTVNGRDIVNQTIHTQDIKGRAGSYFLSNKLNTREIKIKILVVAEDNQRFRLKFEELNKVFSVDTPKVLKFSDEPNRNYYAVFTNAEIPDEVSNQTIITLTFVCHDPFKYSDDIRSQGTVINYNGDFDTLPKITIQVNQNVNEVRLLHVEKQQYIRLKGSYLAGNVIVIDMKEKTITLNGRNDLAKLDAINSRFFSFSKGRNTLNVTNNFNVSCTYREVYL